MSLNKPVFIIGYPRSGTTLLQCMLSAHPQLFSLPETHFFSEIMRKLCKSADVLLTCQDVPIIFQYLQETMNIKETLLDEFLGSYPKNHVTGKQIFEFVIDCFRPEDDFERSLRVVEKTPMHALFVSEISQLYPDAKFLHIVRDPRDAISSSMKKIPVNLSKWLPFYIRSWKQVVQNIKKSTEVMPNTILTLRYEDIVSEPVHKLQEICHFLGLHYENEMISEFSHQYKRNVLTKETPWKQDIKSGTINIHKEKWREGITDAQAWLIEVQARKEMAKYKYTQISSPSLSNKIGVLWQTFMIGWKEDQRATSWIKHFLKDLIDTPS